VKAENCLYIYPTLHIISCHKEIQGKYKISEYCRITQDIRHSKPLGVPLFELVYTIVEELEALRLVDSEFQFQKDAFFGWKSQEELFGKT
jgi:hypothetical protein